MKALQKIYNVNTDEYIMQFIIRAKYRLEKALLGKIETMLLIAQQ